VRRIYLDHNATTPLDPQVLQAMTAVLGSEFGNPSSLHWFGQRARAALDLARAKVAALIGGTANEIVFTGSGTEADNMALRGVAGTSREPRRKVLYTAIEHHAVVNTGKALAEQGIPTEAVRVGPDGIVDLDDLGRRLGPDVALVSIMLANNETGLIQPVAEVARRARAAGALVHCDAVQAAGKISIDVGALAVDLLTLSAHKFYGPKGAGALYVRRGTRLTALLRGGAQEKNRRAGTENVAAIVGMGEAAARAAAALTEEAARETKLRDALEAELLSIEGTSRNGEGPRVPNTANVSFEGIEAESLLMALDLAGVAVSTGAACAAGAIEPSHVLRAMALPMARIEGSIRLSIGRGTTEEDVREAAGRIAEAVSKQRALRRPTSTREARSSATRG
jgi:cysteine desulfurase